MPLIRLTEPTAPQSPPSDLSTPNVIPSVAYGPTSDGRDDPFVQPGIAALGEPTHPACFLDGADTDPNVSSIEPPHPDNLVNPFPGVPHKFYNVTVGDKVGIHSDWLVAQSHSQGFPGGACKSEKGWEEARDAYTRAYQRQCIRLVSSAPSTPTGSPARKKHRSAASPSPFHSPRGTANDPIHVLSTTTTPISSGTFPVGGVGSYSTSDPIIFLGTRLFLAPHAVSSMDHSDLPRTSTLGPASVTPGGRGRVSSGSGSSSLRVSSSLRGTSSPFTPTGAGSEAPSVAATRIIRRFRNHIDIQGHKIKIAKPSSDDSCDGKVINVSDFNSTDSEAELVGKMRPTTPLPAAFNSTSSSVIEQDIESDYTFDDYEATPELNDILNRADTAAAVIHAASSSPAHQ